VYGAELTTNRCYFWNSVTC